MKLLAMLVVVAIIALAIWGVALLIQKAVRHYRQKHEAMGPWEAIEDWEGTTIVFFLQRGKQVKRLPFTVDTWLSTWEFEEKLAEARLKAEDRADTMNRKV